MTGHTHPPAVRVKPLFWKQNPRHTWVWGIEDWPYDIRKEWAGYIGDFGNELTSGPYLSLDLAVAAGQIIHDARIMAAIEPAPDPRDEVIAQLVGAAEEMAVGVIVECDFDGDHSPDFGRRYVELRAALAAAKAGK